MTLSYFARLLCLCSACFFAIHLLLGIVVSRVAPFAIRHAERMNSSSAASLLLTLRLLPPTAALLIVSALCVPSYFRFEPETASEPVSWTCLIAAILGFAIFAVAILRGCSAYAASLRYIRQCRRESTSCFVLAGILRPQVFISKDLLSRLSRDQLRVALRHERAHQVSFDNFKRLLLAFAPGLLGFATLERAWARCAEWAADDRAVVGNIEDSLALAEALVRIARLSTGLQSAQLATSLLADGEDLTARVDRLLGNSSATNNPSGARGLIALALLAAGIATCAIPLQFVHETLERLIH